MRKLVITEPGLRRRRMRNGCVRKHQEAKSDRVSAIIIAHITNIIHVIISFSICSNVYRSYLAVGILTNYYILLGDRLNILFTNPARHTCMLFSTLMSLKSMHQ